MVAPESAMLPGATVVRVPPQTAPEELATVRPAGRVSVNATPVNARVFAGGLAMANVKAVVPLDGMTVVSKAFLMTGGATTVRAADAVTPAPPSVEDAALDILFFVPALVPVTLTEKTHCVDGARLAPERLIEPPPAAAVIWPPPHEPVR